MTRKPGRQENLGEKPKKSPQQPRNLPTCPKNGGPRNSSRLTIILIAAHLGWYAETCPSVPLQCANTAFDVQRPQLFSRKPTNPPVTKQLVVCQIAHLQNQTNFSSAAQDNSSRTTPYTRATSKHSTSQKLRISKIRDLHGQAFGMSRGRLQQQTLILKCAALVWVIGGSDRNIRCSTSNVRDQLNSMAGTQRGKNT